MTKFAPANDGGLKPYVVSTKTVWDREPHDRIEWASDLNEAKRHFGWTRQLHTHVTVRRAKVDDMPAASPSPHADQRDEVPKWVRESWERAADQRDEGAGQ